MPFDLGRHRLGDEVTTDLVGEVGDSSSREPGDEIDRCQGRISCVRSLLMDDLEHEAGSEIELVHQEHVWAHHVNVELLEYLSGEAVSYTHLTLPTKRIV